jgi:hypothetical protein
VSGDGRFCPVSKAMELLLGSRHFNELRRGVPQARLETDLRSLDMVWRGGVGWPEALRSGRVEVHGPGWARRSVPCRLGQSPAAGVPRVAAAAT